MGEEKSLISLSLLLARAHGANAKFAGYIGGTRVPLMDSSTREGRARGELFSSRHPRALAEFD